MAGRSGNAVVHRVLRAPRAVVVFGADDRWTFWARLAIHAATRIWGGAGFILIPHRGGIVEPYFLEVARSFDPDYVLAVDIPPSLEERANPGSVVAKRDGQQLTGEDLTAALAGVPDEDARPRHLDLQARDVVAHACSPYRVFHGDTQDERGTRLPLHGSAEPLNVQRDFPGTRPSACLSVPPTWGGLLGVAVAARCGAVEFPDLDAPEPALEQEERRSLIRWLLGDSVGNPLIAMVHRGVDVYGSFDPSGQDTAFHCGIPGLTRVEFPGSRSRPGLVVVGDEAEDFALAYAHQRLYASALWLPSTWLEEVDDPNRWYWMYRALNLYQLRLRQKGKKLTVSSRSMGLAALQPLVDELKLRLVSRGDQQEAATAKADEAVSVGQVAWGKAGACELVVGDQFMEDFNAPVTREDDGSTTMEASCPPAFVQSPDLATWDDLRWHVVLTFEGAPMPPGRGLDGNYLFADRDRLFHTWIRSSRNGISYESDRYDFKSFGQPKSAWLARPRLRIPSLAQWVDQILGQGNSASVLSPAGRRVEVLKRLWGTRQQLIADMSSPLHPLLRAFRSHATSDAPKLTPGMGRVLATGKGDHPREAYLTFAGAKKQVSEMDAAALREGLDRLLETGALRRGLILGCQTCGKEAFNVIDDLAQDNRCPRCGAANHLASTRWPGHRREPFWYYDLHPIAREHMSQNGDVPLLLAHHLAKKTRSYIDSAELEVMDRSQDQKAEIDLIALADEVLVVAEAKRPDNLGEGRKLREEVAKLFAAAERLGADQVVVATAAPTWEARTVNAVLKKAEAYARTHRLDAVRLISGLGTGKVLDEHRSF